MGKKYTIPKKKPKKDEEEENNLDDGRWTLKTFRKTGGHPLQTKKLRV